MSLTSVVDVVVLFIGSDLASTCTRAKQEVARRIGQHNAQAKAIGAGVVILLNGQCISHILHREIEHCFGTRTLIPKLYSVAFSCSLPANFSRLATAVQVVVGEDLAVNLFSGLEAR